MCAFYKKNKYFKIKESYSKNFIIKEYDKYSNIVEPNGAILILSWNKLYKKNLFNNIKYPVGRAYEDVFIVCDLMTNCKKVSYINIPLYYYRMRNNSITHSCKSLNDYLSSIDKCINYFYSNNYRELYEKEKIQYIIWYLYYLYELNYNKEDNKYLETIIQIIRNEIKEANCFEFIDEKNKIKVNKINNNYMCFYNNYVIKKRIKKLIYYN